MSKEHSTTHLTNTIKLTRNDRHTVIGCTFLRLLLSVFDLILKSPSFGPSCENPGRVISWDRPQDFTRPFFLPVYVQSMGQAKQTLLAVLFTQYNLYLMVIFPAGYFLGDFHLTSRLLRFVEVEFSTYSI